MVWFNGQSQISDEEVGGWDPSPETWNHLCHVFDLSTFTIYSQGEVRRLKVSSVYRHIRPYLGCS